jgi:ribosomal protein S18 acetylase RimI-like enzyme
MKWLVCDQHDEIAGFCTVNFLDETTAEILFLYVRMDLHGRGIGAALLAAARKWLGAERPEITTLVLDTVVPEYNQAFYEKQGFAVTGRQVCVRDGLEIPSVILSRPVSP